MTEILKLNSEVSGEVGKLMSRLAQSPRATRYQELCRRIADQALELRVPEWHGNPAIAGRRLRQCERLFTAGVLRDWILESARLDQLAAMAILDAVVMPAADDDAILDVGRRAGEAVTARQEEVARKMRLASARKEDA